MKKLTLILALTLSACVTTSGTYSISALDEQGHPIKSNISMIATGSGIYSARNAMCINHPKATVMIKDINTGKELTSESPYQCK